MCKKKVYNARKKHQTTICVCIINLNVVKSVIFINKCLNINIFGMYKSRFFTQMTRSGEYAWFHFHRIFFFFISPITTYPYLFGIT